MLGDLILRALALFEFLFEFLCIYLFAFTYYSRIFSKISIYSRSSTVVCYQATALSFYVDSVAGGARILWKCVTCC